MRSKIGRNARTRAAALGIMVLCALRAPAAGYSPGASASTVEVKTAESAIKDWPARAGSLARLMVEKYGEPDIYNTNSLVWYNKGPWRRTVVYRKAPLGFLGYRANDILEQSVAYIVPEDKIAELENFESRIKVDNAKAELSSLGESESVNFLTLNLADEIVNDKRNAEEARAYYRRMRQLSAAGKTSRYLEGFIFPTEDWSAPRPLGTEYPIKEP